METLRIECPDCATAGHAAHDCLIGILSGAEPAEPALTIAEQRALELFEALGMLAPDEPPEVAVRARPARMSRTAGGL